jgi:hypothetical protein
MFCNTLMHNQVGGDSVGTRWPNSPDNKSLQKHTSQESLKWLRSGRWWTDSSGSRVHVTGDTVADHQGGSKTWLLFVSNGPTFCALPVFVCKPVGQKMVIDVVFRSVEWGKELS